MSKSDYLETEIKKHLFRTGSFAKPAALYVGMMAIKGLWQAAGVYALNDIVAPLAHNGSLFICTTAGTSGGAEPAWDTAEGAVTNDNTAVFTEWSVIKDAYTGATVPEIAGAGYARVQRDPLDANWSAVVANVAAITFGAPTANWGVVGAFFIVDANANGNMLYVGALSAPKTINNGDAAPSFAPGTLTIDEK